LSGTLGEAIATGYLNYQLPLEREFAMHSIQMRASGRANFFYCLFPAPA
jgi:hypothetical protein